MNQIHLVHSLLGQSAVTIHKYEGLHPIGMSDFLMKNIVLVPCTCVSLLPCVSHPISSAVSIIHLAPSKLVWRSWYLAGRPVLGWMAEKQ